MFERRHYEAIAAVLKRCSASNFFVDEFVGMLSKDNNRFDANRFMNAAGYGQPANWQPGNRAQVRAATNTPWPEPDIKGL